MLNAAVYEQIGDYKHSIFYAKRADSIISKTDNYIWQTRVLGFLASQHRYLKLYKESEAYIKKAILTASRIKDPELAKSTLALLEQENAMSESERENYIEAIRLFKSAGEKFESFNDNQYLVAQNDCFIGQCYLGLKDYNNALKYYQLGLEKWGNLPDNYVKGLIYTGLASIYIEKGQLNLAKGNLDEARKIAKTSDYLEFLLEFYKAETEYYIRKKNPDDLKIAISKRDSVQAELYKQKVTFIDEDYSELKIEKINFEKSGQSKSYIILLTITIIILSFLFFFIYRRKKEREVKKIKEILANIENKPNPITIIPETSTVEEKSLTSKSDESKISVESEEKILKSLEEFEQSNLYLQKDISLSVLSTYCKTNTKYLSHCVNKYKGKDFNNYIQHLRINYIIRKLQKEPIYRKYKMATLAEEAGFSSLGKFSAVFKKETSISPSVFIKHMDE